MRAGAMVLGAAVLFAGGIGVGAWIAGPAVVRVASPAKPAVSPAPTAPTRTATAPAAPAVPLPRLTVPPKAEVEPPSTRPTPAPSVVTQPAPPTAETGPAWRRFAAVAEPANGRPIIAIILDDVGIDKKRAHRAIELPGAITLAFLSYATELGEQTALARERGHELLVHMPMQPHGHNSDPGPNVLDINLGAAEVERRIEWDLGQFDGYVGVNNHMGSLFTESTEGMQLVAKAMRAHGLLFLDSMTSAKSVGEQMAAAAGVPTTRRDVFLDNTDTAAEVEMRLAQTERVARETGTAVAIGHPRDATLNVLETWIPKARAAGFVLVPLTAVIEARMGGPGIKQARR